MFTAVGNEHGIVAFAFDSDCNSESLHNVGFNEAVWDIILYRGKTQSCTSSIRVYCVLIWYTTYDCSFRFAAVEIMILTSFKTDETKMRFNNYRNKTRDLIGINTEMKNYHPMFTNQIDWFLIFWVTGRLSQRTYTYPSLSYFYVSTEPTNNSDFFGV